METLKEWKFTVGAVVAASVVGAHIYKQRRARLALEASWAAWVPPYSEDEFEVLELHEYERTEVWPMLPSTVTLTFFKGDADEVVGLLNAKVGELVKVNPWLCGRLVKHPGPKHNVKLWIPKKPDPTMHLGDYTSPTLVPGQSWEELDPVLKTLVVPEGCHCIDKDTPLFSVLVVRTPAANNQADFALMVSMSHMLGDGHTYYQIYSNLGQPSTISLNPERKQATYNAKCEMMGKRKTAWLHSRGYFVGMIRNIYIYGKLRPAAYYLNKDWIEAEKQRYADAKHEVPWVSTNDILTSLLLSTGGYDSGLMYIGTRNRIAGATDNDAGNYVMGIYFHPSEFTQPREIRKAMTNGKFVGGRKDVLNSWRTYKGNFGVLSSWVAFQKELHLPGCTRGVHYPLPPAWSCSRETHFLFKPTPDTIGVMMMERNDVNGGVAEVQRKNHPAFGERIF